MNEEEVKMSEEIDFVDVPVRLPKALSATIGRLGKSCDLTADQMTSAIVVLSLYQTRILGLKPDKSESIHSDKEIVVIDCETGVATINPEATSEEISKALIQTALELARLKGAL